MSAQTSQLRSTLKQLRGIAFDRTERANVAMAPQEMLDYLAMLAGLKPVYLLGRGFDDANYVSGVIALSKKKGLNVVEGRYWEAVDQYADISAPIAAILAENDKREKKAVYICKAHSIAKELDKIASTGQVSIDDEAKLLGYPVCCVRAHYERANAMNKGFSLVLWRVGKENEDEIRRLVREDVGMAPETEEEKALLQKATTSSEVAPFTSVYMCDACIENPNSAARKLSKQYEQLATSVDKSLWREIKGTLLA